MRKFFSAVLVSEERSSERERGRERERERERESECVCERDVVAASPRRQFAF